MLEANIEARKARHKRVFAASNVLKKVIPSFNIGTISKSNSFVKKDNRRVSNVSATTKLFRSYSLVVAALFVIGAINPANAYSHNSYYAPSLEGVDAYYGDGLMVASEDGYIPKINPQTELADRSEMNGKLIHEIEPGDTISTIAEEYDLKTNTVLWENGLSATSKLRVGDKLVIPPVDGVTHVVEKGQDLKKIASLYSVDADTITKQNQLVADATLSAGQAIFIPSGKPLPTAIDRTNPSKIASTTRVNKSNVGSTQLVSGAAIGANSDSSPATGKTMIFPTRGTITQYFHPGHYAYDIANRDKPPIWAAADGVVVKASSGTWGGGYGNHIIIDHGNGLKTLYGHMEYLSVSVGDHVTQGQVIGKMGRTGNVRGVTGIHLHFEVIQNGVKKSPGNYY